jgi:hypothetical protein
MVKLRAINTRTTSSPILKKIEVCPPWLAMSSWYFSLNANMFLNRFQNLPSKRCLFIKTRK